MLITGKYLVTINYYYFKLKLKHINYNMAIPNWLILSKFISMVEHLSNLHNTIRKNDLFFWLVRMITCTLEKTSKTSLKWSRWYITE